MTRFIFYLIALLPAYPVFSQAAADTSINNLRHPADYQTAHWGSLSYTKLGSGKRPMLLLPEGGFDGSVFQPFMEAHQAEFTFYLLQLPGFSGTNAYPMPPAGESYSRQNWMNGVVSGILNLIDAEQIERPALLGHFLISGHIALRMAVEHGDKVGKVLVVGAPAELNTPPPYDTLGYANRVRFTDQYLAPMWFKTLSRQTWLNGNFLPEVYALDSIQAQRYWEMANGAPLPVLIRYLCEVWGYDFARYREAQAPVLVLVPGFRTELLAKTCNRYLEAWALEKWQEVAAGNGNIRLEQVPNAACTIMSDQPAEFERLVMQFLYR